MWNCDHIVHLCNNSNGCRWLMKRGGMFRCYCSLIEHGPLLFHVPACRFHGPCVCAETDYKPSIQPWVVCFFGFWILPLQNVAECSSAIAAQLILLSQGSQLFHLVNFLCRRLLHWPRTGCHYFLWQVLDSQPDHRFWNFAKPAALVMW